MTESESAEELKEILEDPRYGSSPERRMETLKRFQGYGKMLNLASAVALAWGYFYPRPYVLMLFVAGSLPWVGCLLMYLSRGIVVTDKKKGQVRPSIAYAIFASAATLFGRAADVNHFQSLSLWVSMVALAGLLLALSLGLDSPLRESPGTCIVYFLILMGYAYGVVIEANVLLDRGEAREYQASIGRKEVIHQRGAYHRLHLSPWGPEKGPNDLNVDVATFDAVSPERPVTIVLRPGALGVPWYYLDPR